MPAEAVRQRRRLRSAGLSQHGPHWRRVCGLDFADCLETVEEIGIRARDQWRGLGGEELLRVDCPNAHPTWVEAVTQLVLHANGTAASARDAAATPEASESDTETPAT